MSTDYTIPTPAPNGVPAIPAPTPESSLTTYQRRALSRATGRLVDVLDGLEAFNNRCDFMYAPADGKSGNVVEETLGRERNKSVHDRLTKDIAEIREAINAALYRVSKVEAKYPHTVESYTHVFEPNQRPADAACRYSGFAVETGIGVRQHTFQHFTKIFCQ